MSGSGETITELMKTPAALSEVGQFISSELVARVPSKLVVVIPKFRLD